MGAFFPTLWLAAFIYSTPAGAVKAPYPSGMGFVLTYDVATWLEKCSCWVRQRTAWLVFGLLVPVFAFIITTGFVTSIGGVRARDRKNLKKFTLFTDHNGSLLRRQPGAMTIGHSPKGKERS